MEIDKDSRLLFMKYALPCAGTLCRRGKITQQEIDHLTDLVKNNETVPKDAEKIFKVALAVCTLNAMDAKKKSIDSEVIRNYFLFGHDDVIEQRYEEMKDFDPEGCRTRAGTVDMIEKDYALVATVSGRKKYRTDFTPTLRKGDTVVVHWGFVVEKITKQVAEKMNALQKEKLVEVAR